MIKINLKNRKAAVGVAAGGTAAAGGLSEITGKFNDLFSRVNAGGFQDAQTDSKSLGVLVLIYAAILGGAWWFTDDSRTKHLAEVATEMAALDSKIALLDSELNKTNGYEQIRKSLEADEKAIRTKIATIQELIHERGTPPKILMTLSEAIPKNVWLRDFSLTDRKFKISGSSDGMDVVSDFMKSLEETIYFKNVTLRSSKQDATPKAGRTNAVFDLEAERR